MALTMLERWLASDDHATHTLVAQMLRAWLNQQAAASPTNDRLRLRAITILASSDDPTVVSARLYHLLRTAWTRIEPTDVRTGMTLLHGRGDGRSITMDRWMSLLGEMVRDHPSDDVIREVLGWLMPTIVPPDRPDVRVRWATTLWTLLTNSTCSNERRQTIATALIPMMQDPMVAALVHAQLCTDLSLLQTIPAPIGDTLLAGLIHTAHADAVLSMIAQEIRQNPNAIARFDSILAAGWGNGHDHRILQIIDSVLGPHWHTVLTEGVTTSVGAEVCDRLRSWFSRDLAMALIVHHIQHRWGGPWPTRDDRDRVCPDRPAIRPRNDGHSLGVNRQALALAGIIAAPPDPDGGHIHRDDNSEPTGIVLETAMRLVQSIGPPPGRAERIAAVRLVIREALRYDLTALHVLPATTLRHSSISKPCTLLATSRSVC
jgi:hypothetical protein